MQAANNAHLTTPRSEANRTKRKKLRQQGQKRGPLSVARPEDPAIGAADRNQCKVDSEV